MGEPGMTYWTKKGHNLLLSHKVCMHEVAVIYESTWQTLLRSCAAAKNLLYVSLTGADKGHSNTM